jgi:HAD superfamily 5'-nucleotidase-like hydrolase
MALQNIQRESPSTDLYAGEWHIEPARRVFVNRNLRMRNIRLLGFDMDYTLAVYDKHVLEKLAFEATRDKLVSEAHYPETIRGLQYDPDCCIRGLVVDKRQGNGLKIDQYGYVTRAYHGLQLIPSDRRKSMYRATRIRLSSNRYMSIDTLFGLPEATLFLQLVDHFERVQSTPWKDYTRVYEDVRRCIDRAHADDTIKREIVREPERFILKDPNLPATLVSFKAQGKKLFLLTNSEPYFTQIVMHHLLDGAHDSYPAWRDYFDVVVVSARKPDFYESERQLVLLGQEEMRAAGMPANCAPVHVGGSARALERHAGHSGEEVLYVGDHTFGDILRAKKRPGWRTAMLIEELRSEIELDRSLAPEYQHVDGLLAKRNAIILEINRLRRRLQQHPHREGDPALTADDRTRLNEQAGTMAARLETLQAELAATNASVKERKARIDHRFNKHWGKLFKCGDINSRFGQQVKDFACVYTSTVSNFLAYPDDMYFRSTREIMPHEMGLESF